MRIKTVVDSQLLNVQKLLDYLPSVDNNVHSMLGLLMVCDRGCGKKSIIALLMQRNFKVITIASKIGSEHPIVGSTVVKSYVEKKIENSNLRSSMLSASDLESNYGVLQSNVELFRDSIRIHYVR